MLWSTEARLVPFTILFILVLHLQMSVVSGSTLLGVRPGSWGVLSYPTGNWDMRDPSDPQSYYRKVTANYRNGMNVEWLIEAHSNNTIIIQVLQLKTESCCDFLTIYDGLSTILKKYSGDHTLAPILLSSGNKVRIEFTSDSSNTDEGFALRYTVNEPCKNEFVNDTGTFTKAFSMQKKCETWIRTKDNTLIEVIFDRLQLEEGSTFTVVDGSSNVTLSLGSGVQLPQPLVTGGNQIQFQLNGTGMYNGIFISYPRGSCDFSSSLCQWVSVDVLRSWKRSATKHHVYFREIPGHTGRGYRALLRSPRLESESPKTRCLILTYHMFGMDVYELNVYILSYMNISSSRVAGGKRIWQKYSETGSQPTTEAISYSAEGSYSILIEAVRGYGLDYTFIVDAITIKTDCMEEKDSGQNINCTFNTDLCSWTQSRDDNSNWQFETSSGDTNNIYLMASFGYKPVKDGPRKSILESPSLTHSEPAEMSFHCWLQGQACLTVELAEEEHTRVLWMRCSTETGAWMPDTVVIPTFQGHQVKLRLIANLTTEADVVKLSQVTLGTRTPENFSEWTCDFKETFCGLRQEDKNALSWIINNVGLSQSFTADYPSFLQFRCGNGLVIPGSWRCNGRKDCTDGIDEIGCGSCPSYMFRCPNDPQNCISRPDICNNWFSSRYDGIQGKNIYCGEEERCHMHSSSENKYGCHDNTHAYLRNREVVRVWDGTADCPDGSDETGWKEFHSCPVEDRDSTVTATTDYFFSVPDHCPDSELPVAGKCVPLSCLCNETLVGSDIITEQLCIHNRQDEESVTVLQVQQPSGETKTKQTASFHTAEVVLQESEYMCASFWYLLTATDLRQHFSLRLYQNAGSRSVVLWGQTGQKSRDWLHAAILVPFTEPLGFSLSFEAEVPGNGGDITVAVRDIVLGRRNLAEESVSPCSDFLLSTTTFQQSLGIWSGQWFVTPRRNGKLVGESVFQHSDAKQWILVKSGNHLRETGPVLPPQQSTLSSKEAAVLLGDASDSSNSLPDGYLLCNSENSHGLSYLWSLPVPSSGGLCVKFMYFMYGQDWTELSVGIYDRRNSSFRSIFSLSGSQGDNWREEEVNISPEVLPGYTQIIFSCNTLPKSETDIALGNVRILRGTCGSDMSDFRIRDAILGIQWLLTSTEQGEEVA